MTLKLVNRTDESEEVVLEPEQEDAVRAFRKRTKKSRLRKIAEYWICFANEGELWFVCNCLGDRESNPPIAVPVEFKKRGKLTLRSQRRGRPAHASFCEFFVDSDGKVKKRWNRKAQEAPDGLFEVVHRHPEHGGLSSGSASAGGGGGASGARLPMLSQQLRRLLRDAELNTYVGGSNSQTLPEWRPRLRGATHGIDIAPGRKLHDFWFPYWEDWVYGKAGRKLRRAASGWPEDHLAQAFICWAVPDADSKGVGTIENENRVNLPCDVTIPKIHGTPIKGPYLFIGVVVARGARSRPSCVEAYAQPIYSMSYPVPVDSDTERRAFESLQCTVNRLAGEYPGAEFKVVKPLFEENTGAGACIPDFLVEARRNGQPKTFVIEVMGFARPEYLLGKEITHKRMKKMGSVHLMDARKFSRNRFRAGREGIRIERTLRQEVKREWTV